MSDPVSKTVGDIPSSGTEATLVTIKADATVGDCLKLFAAHKILSCPVVDAKDDSKIVGVITNIDILTRVVFDDAFEAFKDGKSASAEELKALVAKNVKLFKDPVSSATGMTAESAHTWMYSASDDLDKLLTSMSSGVHRVLVTLPTYEDPEGAPTGNKIGYLSQKDVAKYLMGSADSKKAMALKVKDATKPAIATIALGATALATFRKMLIGGDLTALPLINEKGELVDTISATDFRTLTTENVENLLLPIEKFIEKASGRKLGGAQITCTWETTLEEATKLLLTGKVHRAWVVDEAKKPVGAIGFSDIIRTVYTLD